MSCGVDSREIPQLANPHVIYRRKRPRSGHHLQGTVCVAQQTVGREAMSPQPVFVRNVAHRRILVVESNWLTELRRQHYFVAQHILRLLRVWFDSPKQGGKPFRHRRVGQYGVAQGHIRKPRVHRDLNDRHDLTSLGRERGEAEDSVAVGGD